MKGKAQDERVSRALGPAIIILPPADRLETLGSVKRACCRVVLGDFEDEGIGTPAAGFAAGPREQGCGDAAAALSRGYAKRKNLALPPEVERQDESHRPGSFRGDGAEKSGDAADLGDRVRSPRVFRKAGSMLRREQGSGLRRQRIDAHAHLGPHGRCRGGERTLLSRRPGAAVERVTSGERR